LILGQLGSLKGLQIRALETKVADGAETLKWSSGLPALVIFLEKKARGCELPPHTTAVGRLPRGYRRRLLPAIARRAEPALPVPPERSWPPGKRQRAARTADASDTHVGGILQQLSGDLTGIKFERDGHIITE
jgi:hypothetical protein